MFLVLRLEEQPVSRYETPPKRYFPFLITSLIIWYACALPPILMGANAHNAVDWLPYVQPSGDPHTVYRVHQCEPCVYIHQEPPLGNTYPGVFDTDDDFNQEIVS
jgi:hypothetical protein